MSLKITISVFIYFCFLLSSISQPIFSKLAEIDSLRSRSKALLRKGETQDALLRLDSAQIIAATNNIDSLQAEVLTDYAEPLAKSGNFIQAIEKCQQAFEIFDSLNSDGKKGEALYLLGNLYCMSGDLITGGEYYEKAVSVIEKTKNKEGLSSALNNHAMALNRTGQFKKAENIIRRVINLKLEDADTIDVIHPYINLAETLNNQNRYDEALTYLEKMHRIVNKHELVYEMTAYFNAIGKTLEKKGDIKAAEKNYLEALDFAQRNEFIDYLKVVNENLVSFYKQKGNFEKALLHQQNANIIKDSLFTVEKQNQIEKLRETFEAAEKEKEIEILKKDQSINKLVIQTLILLVVIAFLLFGIGVFYQRYRIKKNKEIAEIKEIQLTQELVLKSQQLTSKTLEMVRKNDLLSSLSGQLIIAQKEKKIDDSVYNQIDKEIDFHHQMEDDWEQFEVAFNDVHKGYIDQLKFNYPKLTSNELRHCALLKLGLSIKETSNLLGIAPPSVKVSRNRIKKKLKLSAEESLPNFLLSM